MMGRKENDRARQAVFLTPLNPLGNDPEEEKPHFETRWKRNQDAVYWVRLSNAQYQRFLFLANEVICNHGLRHNTKKLH